MFVLEVGAADAIAGAELAAADPVGGVRSAALMSETSASRRRRITFSMLAAQTSRAAKGKRPT